MGKKVELVLSTKQVTSDYIMSSQKTSVVSLAKRLKVTGLELPEHLISYLMLLPIFIPVDPAFAMRFKYAAGLRALKGEGSQDRYAVGHGWKRGIMFVGRIPETVLDKILLAQQAGIEVITIHSTHELPIAFTDCDPIVIGWFSNPGFLVEDFRRQVDRCHNGCALGFIIAIWDYDKEIEALG